MTTPRVTVPVEDLAGKLKAIRDKFLMPTPDKDFTDYAIMTRCIEALSAAPAPEGQAVDALEIVRDPTVEGAKRFVGVATREEAPAEAGEDELKAIARIIFPERERVKMDREWGGNRSHSRARWNKAIAQAREIRALRAQPPAREDAKPVWVDGVPTKHQAKEWFIAETTFGERVVLTALPEEYAYDFKTADETYIKADCIKRWMPFPDSQYRFPCPAPDALRVAVEALEPFARAADGLDGLWSEDDWRWNDSVRSGVTVRDIRRARQALAALQAEQGAK